MRTLKEQIESVINDPSIQETFKIKERKKLEICQECPLKNECFSCGNEPFEWWIDLGKNPGTLIRQMELDEKRLKAIEDSCYTMIMANSKLADELSEDYKELQDILAERPEDYKGHALRVQEACYKSISRVFGEEFVTILKEAELTANM